MAEVWDIPEILSKSVALWKRVKLLELKVLVFKFSEIFRNASRLHFTFIWPYVTSTYEIFKNILKYVWKICKRNIIHHFLINSNITTPISMGSKKKLLNTWTQAGLAGVALEWCRFLAGVRGTREKIEREYPPRAPALRSTSIPPAAKATRTQPIQFVYILLRFSVTERNKITFLVKQK